MQHPSGSVPSPLPPPPPPLLPPGWVSATDPSSGRIYYANPTTGETSWTPPPPPPPPPPPAVQLHAQPPPMNAAPTVTTAAQQQMIASTATSQITLCGPQLVSHVQTLLQTATDENARNSLLEERLSVGTMADLCNLQKTESSYYEALDPQSLDPTTSIPPTMEHGRLEIRLQSLDDKLRRIQHE